MPITLITGPANAGKARAVLNALREHRARGEQPLLVLPTHAHVQRHEAELGAEGLLPGVRAMRFAGLMAEIVGRAGGAPHPLGTQARERVLAKISGRASRGVTRALAAFIAELQVERVSAARLRAALAAWADADPAQAARAERLGTLYEEYERLLGELGSTDSEQRATRALDALRRTPARWGAVPVLLYGFDDFTRLQLDAIETLGSVVGARLTVSFTFERGREAFAGRARTFQTLLALAREHRELGCSAERHVPAARAALHHLERHLFEPARTATPPAGEAVRLLEGGGERAELELVAEEIAGLLEGGMKPAEIALAHRSPAAIAELLEEVFTARRIPYALQRRVRFADTALGGALLGALAVACEPDAGLEALLAWLRAPGVLAEEPELADELEARARRAGVATAAGARTLWEAESWPLALLDPLERLRDAAARRDSTGGARALIEGAARELECLAGAPRDLAPRGCTPAAGERMQQPTTTTWPLAVARREARALEAARAALAELLELTPEDPDATAAVLAADAGALIATLRGLELTVGEDPATTGDAVAVLDPLALRARDTRALFLCGLQEGVFPAPAHAEPLLSEDERRGLVESSGLLALAGDARRSEDALASERYLFYAAVACPRELLVLSWHTADDDGLERSRSLFVDDVRDIFACDLHGARRRRALGEVGEGIVGSAALEPGATRDRAAPASSDERLAALSDEHVLGELRAQPLWSASALESWAGCPTRWFVERLLRARDLEPEPEPLARGALAHAALRDVLDGLRRETGSARLHACVLERARELLRAALHRHEPAHPLSVAPERVPGVRRRLRADLERYLEHAAIQDSPLEPTYLELPFGFPEEPQSLPALELDEGVRLRGRIDRVDLDPTGTDAVVYDYKGAHAPEAGRWARERNFQVALYMQVVEGLPGVRAAGGFYQPLAGRDLRARGALDRDAGIALDCVRGDAREPAELRELVDETLLAARTAARQVRGGALEARPDTCGFGGGGCQYPTICRCER